MAPAKLIKIGLWLVYIVAAGLYTTAKGEALLGGNTSTHLGAAGWAAPESWQAAFQARTADSVCLVRTADGSAGSGSLVEVEGRLFVLTNFHVVREDRSGQPHGQARVTFTTLGVEERLTLVATDKDSDVVALDGEPLRGRAPPLWVADSSAYEQGARGVAEVYGHPLAGAMRGRATQYWRGADLYAVDESGHPVAAVQYAGGAISGESGGPLVAEGAQVVAICWGSDDRGAGFAVPLPRIHNLLRCIFKAQCYGPGCQVGRGGGQVIISQPPGQAQPRGPQVWVNPNFGPPVQEPPAPDWGPPYAPPSEPATDYRGPLVAAGSGLAAFLANFRKRL